MKAFYAPVHADDLREGAQYLMQVMSLSHGCTLKLLCFLLNYSCSLYLFKNIFKQITNRFVIQKSAEMLCCRVTQRAYLKILFTRSPLSVRCFSLPLPTRFVFKTLSHSHFYFVFSKILVFCICSFTSSQFRLYVFYRHHNRKFGIIPRFKCQCCCCLIMDLGLNYLLNF